MTVQPDVTEVSNVHIKLFHLQFNSVFTHYSIPHLHFMLLSYDVKYKTSEKNSSYILQGVHYMKLCNPGASAPS
jgi:hypothetical protein